MKKLLLFLSILILSTFASAQYTYQIVLRNAAAPNSTTSGNIIGSGAAFHNLTWNVSGTVSTCSVRVDSSVDGITWSTGDVIGATTCTSNGNTLSASHIVNYVRINLVTFTGTAPVFTANLSGYITQPSGGGTVTSVTCGTGLSGGTITSTGTCATSSSLIVGLFTSCSGTQYLGADGACHTATGGPTNCASTNTGPYACLESHVASSSATLAFTQCINNSAYHNFIVVLQQLVPATTATQLQMRFSTDGGSTYDNSSKYAVSAFGSDSVGSGVTGNTPATATTQINLRGGNDVSNSADYGITGQLEIFNPGGAHNKLVIGNFGYFLSSDANLAIIETIGGYINTTTANAFDLFFASGNISTGTAYCLGATP